MHRLLKSFAFALGGIAQALKTQRNMRIHLVAAVLVLFISLYLRLGPRDFLLVLFSIALVFMAELLNTAIEAAVDLAVSGEHPLARTAKDVAAGAVLVAAANAVVVGYAVIYQRLEGFTFYYLPKIKSSPLPVVAAALFLAVLAAAGLVLRPGKGKEGGRGMPSICASLAFAGATVIFLMTGSFLVGTVACLVALLAAGGRLGEGRHTLAEVAVGAALGVLAALAAFRLAGW